jgi:hypothetical protein
MLIQVFELFLSDLPMEHFCLDRDEILPFVRELPQCGTANLTKAYLFVKG